MEEVFLQFDFKNESGMIVPLQFNKPEQIFTTDQVDEVLPLLHALEAEHNRGKYIAGYLSYEAAQAFDPNYQPKKQGSMPLLWFASFAQPVNGPEDRAFTDYTITRWQPTITEQEYEADIKKIKAAIENGVTNQVNYTTRFTSQFSGDAYAFYQQLLENQQASYNAYLDIGRFQILSASPELFFKINQTKITTRPMKGTIKRGRTFAEDQANKAYLLQSKKERAENLMIVDVLQKDLTKLAVPGSVKVPERLTIETYPTLHQMTSTVTAELKENSRIVDWFTALFPCGSITGTPRLETMELIEQLERTPRDVYCGAIGYITPAREAIFNVPIRTVQIDQAHNQAIYGVGGGITAASEAAKEYAEIETKAAFLTKTNRSFRLIESLLLSDGQYPYLTNHFNRLADSASYYSYRFNASSIRKRVLAFAEAYPTKDYKVRLLLDAQGEIHLSAEKIQLIDQPVTAYLAKAPIDKENPYLYHKTTIREQYDQLAISEEDNFSTLLWNEQAELTEFTIGNLVLKIAGQYLTPPIDSGVLPGVFRQYLLDQKRIKPAILRKEMITEAEEVWLINAVRGWVKVEIVR